jgi:hypothetical protein
MYNKCNCGCGNNTAMPSGNACTPNPVIAPKKVCVSQSNRYIEQPVICPIEHRHIQNLVYYPRYYPRYEQTFVTKDPCGNIVSGNGMPFNTGNPMASGMPYMGMNDNACHCGCKNSFKQGYGL